MTEQSRVVMKFGVVKRPTLNQVESKAFQSISTDNNEQVDMIVSFENGQLQSTTPKIIKQELVIPSQPNVHHKILKIKSKSSQLIESNPLTTSSNLEIDRLNDEARRALILEAQQAKDAWNERNENGSVRVQTIEQDSMNTFMINRTNDEETKETENADYDQVPIEEFGMAVLRGMGYKEDKGLGVSNKKQADIFVPETRPRGLGLGADRKILEKINQLKRNLKQAGIDEKDDLCYEKGAFVLIEKGPHQDQYGTIESIEEDTARLNVALAIGGTNRKKEIISISQYNVKLVTEKEFLKYSKYVNKSKAEQVEKETSDQLMKDYHHKNNHHYEKEHKRHRSSKKDHDDDDRQDYRYHESSRSRRH